MCPEEIKPYGARLAAVSGGRFRLLSLIIGSGLFVSTGISGTTNSWRVFQTFQLANATTGSNTVLNPGMETLGTTTPLAAWLPYYGLGYSADTSTAHSGTVSLKCSTTNATDIHCGYQIITLNQTIPKPIKLSGWSKALNVSGVSDADYSVYLDIFYTNGTPLFGQTIPFSVGTHDWENQARVIVPTQPIGQINVYLLFRNSHTGTVWFDDITVAEIEDPVAQFDGALVINNPPTPPPFNATNGFALTSGDGLQLQVAQDGGVITSLAEDTNNLHVPGSEYASGWFLCDRQGTSDWWNVGGWVTAANGTLQQQGVVPALNLSAAITYSVTNNAIRMQATVSNLQSSDRAISLCFALPTAFDGGSWWNSPRKQVRLDDAIESANLTYTGWGARNQLSQYPLATAATTNSALTLATPPDPYRPVRLTYNRMTHQFYAVFDLGISAITTNSPQQVTAEVWLYRSDPAWGMRSGLAGLYARFPAAYGRAFTNEGIWVAFASVSGITNLSDFGIGYHEISYASATVKEDDTNGIPSFRYVSEPWSYWMNMPGNIPNTNYASVYNYLLTQYSQGEPYAAATLSSGIRDQDGSLEFAPAAQPWCPYGAAFYLNASPFITDPVYPLNKFALNWNSNVWGVYSQPQNGQLDGEYIDSFNAYATSADFSTNHQRGTTLPLLYSAGNSALMTPLMFGTLEMAQAIAHDVHALGKPIIGNAVYIWPFLPIGQGLFDFAGAEVYWFDAAGNWNPPADDTELYARALSGQRPYGILLNTDFTQVTHAKMETYLRFCAFYGFYPSAFSADGQNNNYFSQPALYERDRDLFKKYVPVIRALSLAGWQPVTGATVDTAAVGLEAYGTNTSTGMRYLALLNFSSNTVNANVTLNPSQWANPGGQWLQLTNLFDGGGLSLNVGAGSNSFPQTLQPYQSLVYGVPASPLTRPVILLDGSFGIHSNQFGFAAAGLPGQVLVIEASTNLTNWLPIQSNTVPANGRIIFSDGNSGLFNPRFYRARYQ